MKINCLSGYFRFEETELGEISKFASLFDLDLVFKDGYYIFSSLGEAPGYSVAGAEYLGATAIKTFSGNPWDVMRENNLVYNFLTDEVLPLSEITQQIKISLSDYYYLTDGWILPGSITEDGKRVREYAAWFSFDDQTFRYSEVTFE